MSPRPKPATTVAIPSVVHVVSASSCRRTAEKRGVRGPLMFDAATSDERSTPSGGPRWPAARPRREPPRPRAAAPARRCPRSGTRRARRRGTRREGSAPRHARASGVAVATRAAATTSCTPRSSTDAIRVRVRPPSSARSGRAAQRPKRRPAPAAHRRRPRRPASPARGTRRPVCPVSMRDDRDHEIRVDPLEQQVERLRRRAGRRARRRSGRRPPRSRSVCRAGDALDLLAVEPGLERAPHAQDQPERGRAVGRVAAEQDPAGRHEREQREEVARPSTTRCRRAGSAARRRGARARRGRETPAWARISRASG